MIEGFDGFVMISLMLSKTGLILFSNAKEILQKMLARKYLFISWQTYVGLKISECMYKIYVLIEER